MIQYQRNNEDLKVAIREHSINGYPLQVPIFKKATGLKTNTVRELTAVIVEPVEPMTWTKLAEHHNWSEEKFGMDHWVKYARDRHMPHADTEPLRWLHPKSRVLLEEGYKVSERDIRKEWYLASGHINKRGNVLSESFDIRQVSMHPEDIQNGMIVEFRDNQNSPGIPGRVVGTATDPEDGSKIIYLETFEPVPALLAPKALAPWLIQPSFVPDKTWVIGYGTLEAMKRKKVDIPQGMFDPKDPEKRVWFLDQPIPLATIEAFCKQYYPQNPECVWQSMVLIVLPIHPAADPKGRHSGGIFKPYPDDLLTTEIEAQIDYYGEGMEFED